MLRIFPTRTVTSSLPLPFSSLITRFEWPLSALSIVDLHNVRFLPALSLLRIWRILGKMDSKFIYMAACYHSRLFCVDEGKG